MKSKCNQNIAKKTETKIILKTENKNKVILMYFIIKVVIK